MLSGLSSSVNCALLLDRVSPECADFFFWDDTWHECHVEHNKVRIVAKKKKTQHLENLRDWSVSMQTVSTKNLMNLGHFKNLLTTCWTRKSTICSRISQESAPEGHLGFLDTLVEQAPCYSSWMESTPRAPSSCAHQSLGTWPCHLTAWIWRTIPCGCQRRIPCWTREKYRGFRWPLYRWHLAGTTSAQRRRSAPTMMMFSSGST